MKERRAELNWYLWLRDDIQNLVDPFLNYSSASNSFWKQAAKEN